MVIKYQVTNLWKELGFLSDFCQGCLIVNGPYVATATPVHAVYPKSDPPSFSQT